LTFDLEIIITNNARKNFTSKLQITRQESWCY